jgi:hypothetical protein
LLLSFSLFFVLPALVFFSLILSFSRPSLIFQSVLISLFLISFFFLDYTSPIQIKITFFREVFVHILYSYTGSHIAAEYPWLHADGQKDTIPHNASFSRVSQNEWLKFTICKTPLSHKHLRVEKVWISLNTLEFDVL